MSWNIDFVITKAPWLSDPTMRWQAGLLNAGKEYREAWQPHNYPPQSELSTYTRTGTLAHTADFQVEEYGKSMNLGGPIVMRYLLYGTGIYGPTGEPIRPVTAKALAWPNTGAISLLTGSMGRRAAEDTGGTLRNAPLVGQDRGGPDRMGERPADTRRPFVGMGRAHAGKDN